MSDSVDSGSRRWLGWSIVAVVVALLVALGWIGVRGLGAVNDLQQVRSTAAGMRTAIGSGDLDRARRDASRIADRAASAHQLTSDPIWRAFEALPWLGANLSAVSEVAAIADDVAAGALTPLLDVAGDIDLTALGFRDGAIDLTPFAAAEKPLREAAAVLEDAQRRALRIDDTGTLPPLAEAVVEARGTLGEVSSAVGTLHGAAALLPGMLGGDGPRNYVVAMQNNAEVRSAGGIIGALALVRADGGAVSMVKQASTADFPPREEPLPLSDATIGLFEHGPGRYIQNITSIPDFTEAAPLIAARWQEQFGDHVDGVIAVDTGVARDLLAVTGPQQVGPFTIDADNVLTVLLSDVYREIPDPRMQDAAFAQVASVLFDAALHSDDPRALISAIADAAGENRIRVWSGHETEQQLIARSTLAGDLPRDDAETAHVGVLFNDATGAKMNFYTRASFSTAVGVCHGTPTTRVRVTWHSDAPADAASVLPEYVAGYGFDGIPIGSVRTLVAVFGPEGAVPVRIDRDGNQEKVQTAQLDDRMAIQHVVTLAPGESSTITIDYAGGHAGQSRTLLQHTPLIERDQIDTQTLDCE